MDTCKWIIGHLGEVVVEATTYYLDAQSHIPGFRGGTYYGTQCALDFVNSATLTVVLD